MIHKSSNGFSDVFLIITLLSLSRAHKMMPGKLPSPEECAQVIRNPISDGNITRINEYPWMVLIEYKRDENGPIHGCAGSLINDRYVLTSAGCLTELPGSLTLFRVRLGEWNTTTDIDCEINTDGSEKCADPHIDVSIEKAIPHEKYNGKRGNFDNNIGLIRLSRSIEYTDFIRPICLPLKEDLKTSTFDGQIMDISGWHIYRQRSNVKLKTQVKVLPLSDCQRVHKKSFSEISQMCVGGGEMPTDLCRGDVGGPLIGLDTNNSKQVYYFTAGVLSAGSPSCNPRVPDVYTRISDYVDWIQDHIES